MYKSDAIGYAIFGGLICFFLGGAFGTLTQKWAMDDAVRTLRQQNRELAEDGRKLAAAAYVCMDHCGTPTCDGPK